MDTRTVGIVGGDDVARMLVECAQRLGVRTAVLDEHGSSSSAGQISALCVEGYPIHQPNKILELAAISDVVTLMARCATEPIHTITAKSVSVTPDMSAILSTYDMFLQRSHLQTSGIPVAHFQKMETELDVEAFASRFGPKICFRQSIKSTLAEKTDAQRVMVSSLSEAVESFPALKSRWGDVLAEESLPVARNLSIAIVRNRNKQCFSFALTEIVSQPEYDLVIAPALLSESQQQLAMKVALQACGVLHGAGTFNVLLSLLQDDSVIVDHVIAHPHRFGNYSVVTYDVNQYELHLRTVLGLPCWQPQLRVGSSATLLLKKLHSNENDRQRFQSLLSIPGVSGHWFGSSTGSDYVGDVTVTAISHHALREKLSDLKIDPIIHRIPAAPVPVMIIWDSSDDRETAKELTSVFDAFSIPYEQQIISPHVTPTKLYTFAETAVDRGLQVVIAMTGCTGTLPAMLSALMPLPVLACPTATWSTMPMGCALQSLDTPAHLPVAFAGIRHPSRTAFLALRILAIHNIQLRKELERKALEQESLLLTTSEQLQRLGRNSSSRMPTS